MKHLLLHNRMAVALTVLCGLLLLILIMELAFLDPAGSIPGSDDSMNHIERPTSARSRFIPKSLATFSEILERPLLFEGRRLPPAPVAAAPSAKPMAPLRLKLEGVAISSVSRVGLLRNTSDNKLLQLVQGTSYQGWTLQTLTADSAKFRRGNDVTEISLETGTSANRRRRN